MDDSYVHTNYSNLVLTNWAVSNFAGDIISGKFGTIFRWIYDSLTGKRNSHEDANIFPISIFLKKGQMSMGSIEKECKLYL